MATWTIQSGTTINHEGNSIILNVEVTGLAFPPDQERSETGNAAKIGPIQGWRMAQSDGTLSEKTDTGEVADGEVRYVRLYSLVVSGGPTTYTAQFKVAIRLEDAGVVALNADAGTTAPKVYRLLAGWITLRNSAGSMTESGPAKTYDATTEPNLAFDASGVGKLPPTDLQLSVDAHAQWVEEGGEQADLTLWTDLSAEGNDLSGAPSADEPDLDDDPGTPNRPVVVFNADTTDPARFQLADPPAIMANTTIAAVFKPGSEGSAATIVGRYNQAGTLSWRMYYDNNEEPPSVVYAAKGSGSPVSVGVGTAEPLVFALLRRAEGESEGPYEFWINGVLAAEGTISSDVNTGTGDLGVGARMTSGSAWGEAFENQINQVALYDAPLGDLALSLVMHLMAQRAVIFLGTPLSGSLSQPYGPGNSVANRRLDRKPIAVINLYGGIHSGTDARARTGQNALWRQATQQPIEDWLNERISDLLNGCDDFEIMFNRPGGTYAEDIVPTYIWGLVEGVQTSSDMVTDTMWDAMKDVWTDRKLSHYNNRNITVPKADRLRRGWFYTGFGLPLFADGTLCTDGRMFNRVVGPATPAIYNSEILTKWTDVDTRFRCLMLDAASQQAYGQFVALVQNNDVRQNYTLIGEAIPTDEDARKGAVWRGNVEFGRAPWWNVDSMTGLPSKQKGYNTHWTTDPVTTPTYFVVQNDEYPYLHVSTTNAGAGSNMTISNVYRFILKGGTPVAWTGTHRKVGAAWNYAMKRVPMNTWDRTGRACRVQR